MEYMGITFQVSSNNIHVVKSCEVHNHDIKREFIRHLFEVVPNLDQHRTPKSMFREWKAHNVLHQYNISVERTRDVDFEFKQKWYYKLGYWFIATFFKERDNG